MTGGSDTTFDDMQSETAIAVSRFGSTQTVVVTFNDQTDNESEGLIEFGDEEREIHPGASLMGWSFSTDGGQSFTYGGKVAPPLEQGWWALWGDPAITTQTGEPESSNVFIGNLAASFRPFLNEKGTISGSVVPKLDGACVSRSYDGGQAFEIFQCFNYATCHGCLDCMDSAGQPCSGDWDCPSDRPYCKGDFYDGGSMAASPAGEVFYALIDVRARTPHVWRSSGWGADFELLPLPFPDAADFVGHPRLRYDRHRGRLYIAHQTSATGGAPTRLASTYYADGAWAEPRRELLGSLTIPFQPVIATTNGDVRTGNQFSFDVGEGEVRFFHNVRNLEDGNLSLRIISCSPELTGCFAKYAFAAFPAPVADRFNPLIRVAERDTGVGERWALVYQTTEFEPGQISVQRAVLDSPSAPIVPLVAVPPRPTCPTLETLYWGDYDDLQPVGSDWLGRPRFLTAFTRSDGACEPQWAFLAEPQHVSATVFP